MFHKKISLWCVLIKIMLDPLYFTFIFCSCVDRKSSDLGIGGMRREYLQVDCAINAVI